MDMNTEVIPQGESFDKGLPITLRNQILTPSIPPAAMYPVAQCIVINPKPQRGKGYLLVKGEDPAVTQSSFTGISVHS